MPFNSFCQRHINNSTAVEVLVGSASHKTPDNVSLYWSKFKKKNYFKVGGFYQNRTVNASSTNILVENIEVDAVFNKSLFSNNRSIFVSAPISIFGGYELLNKGYETIGNYQILTKSNFCYGVSAGIEMEIYLSSRVAFVGNYKGKIYISDNSYRIQTPISVGLKFIKF